MQGAGAGPRAAEAGARTKGPRPMRGARARYRATAPQRRNQQSSGLLVSPREIPVRGNGSSPFPMRFGPTYGNRKARARRPLRRAKTVQWTVFRAREVYFLRTTNVNSDSDVCTKEGETIYSIGSPFFECLSAKNHQLRWWNKTALAIDKREPPCRIGCGFANHIQKQGGCL